MWAKAMQVIQDFLSPVNFDKPPDRLPSASKPRKKKSDTPEEPTATATTGGRGNH